MLYILGTNKNNTKVEGRRLLNSKVRKNIFSGEMKPHNDHINISKSEANIINHETNTKEINVEIKSEGINKIRMNRNDK